MQARNTSQLKKGGLYLLLDPQQCAGRSPVEICLQALDAGASIVQLRDKQNTTEMMLGNAVAMLELCSNYNALFILNDFPEQARQIGAHGVHLGQKDISTASARELLDTHQIVGRSNSSLEEAKLSEDNGADYLAVGAIFPTSTKIAASVVGLQPISDIKQHTSLPLVAIGGIGPDNAHKVVDAGADFICCGSAITSAKDPFLVASQLRKLFDR